MKEPFEVAYKLNGGVIFWKNYEFLGNALEEYEKLTQRKSIKEIIITYLPTWQILVRYDKAKQKEFRKWID